MNDDRILVFAPLPAHEPRSYIHLSLDLDEPLVLDTSTAVLLGNVAPASHGETVHAEVIGDGDASQAFQRFTLKKKPVTYVPAAVPGGVRSSLTLLVNGVRWSEVPTLYGAKPHDQVYVTRIADDGTLHGAVRRRRTGRSSAEWTAEHRRDVSPGHWASPGVSARSKITTLLDRPTGCEERDEPRRRGRRRRPGDDGQRAQRSAWHGAHLRACSVAARLRGHRAHGG